VTTNKDYVIGMTHNKAHKSRLRREPCEKEQAVSKGNEKARKKDLDKLRTEMRQMQRQRENMMSMTMPAASSEEDEAAAASSASSDEDDSETERPRGPNVGNPPAVDTIDFGLSCMGDGTLCAFKHGLRSAHAIGKYEAGDELAVMIAGNNSVGYYRNNKLLYTSERKPKFPLVAACAFAGPGAHAAGVRLRLPTAARGWGLDGTRWESIKAMIREGKLPILVSLGKNSGDIEEYRMSHLSFQEFFAARAIVNVHAFMEIGEFLQADERLRSQSAAIAARVCEGYNFADAPTLTAERYLSELFGVAPAIQAFMDTRWQMVLQMVADLLELRGGLELRCFADSILGDGRIEVGREGLRVTGARALAPYLRACTSIILCFAAAEDMHLGENSLDKEAFAIIDEAVAGSSGEAIALDSPSDVSQGSKGYEINFMPSVSEEVAVTWEPVQGQLTTAQLHTGGVLEKSTTASMDWETGAWSVERIHMDGVGQGVQWTATTTDKMYVIGLTHESTIGGKDLYYKIQHGLRCNRDGKLDVYEPDHHETTAIGNYEAEDELAVMSHGDAVRYYCNEELLYTSSQRSQFPLVAACALADPGAKADNVRLQQTRASGSVHTFDFDCFKGLRSVDLRGVKAASAEIVLNLRIARGLQVKCNEDLLLLGGWDAQWGCFGSQPSPIPDPWNLLEPTVVEMGGEHFGCGVRSKEALTPNQSGVHCFEFVAAGDDGSAFMIGVAGESVGVETLNQRDDGFPSELSPPLMLHSKGWWGVHVYSGGKAGGVYQGPRGETRQCLHKGGRSWHNGLGMSIDLALGQMRFYHGGEEMTDMAINDLPSRKQLYIVTGNLLTGKYMRQTIRVQLPKPTHEARLMGLHWALKAMQEKKQ
jgi:hypothetical protein